MLLTCKRPYKSPGVCTIIWENMMSQWVLWMPGHRQQNYLVWVSYPNLRTEANVYFLTPYYFPDRSIIKIIVLKLFMCFKLIYPLVTYPLKALYDFLFMADCNLAMPSFPGRISRVWTLQPGECFKIFLNYQCSLNYITVFLFIILSLPYQIPIAKKGETS